MRIVHFFKRVRLEEGGVVRAVLDLCSLLARAGHQVTLITCDARDVPAEWRSDPPAPGAPRVVEIGAPALPGAVLSPDQVRRAAAVIAASDVLHLHAVWHPANAQLARAARRLGRPHVVSVHGMLDDWAMSGKTLKKRLFLSLFGRRVLESARGVHLTARSELEQSARWFRNPRGVVIPLLFDLSAYKDLPGTEAARTRLGIQPSDPRRTILFLSRLHPVKGIDLILRAARRMRDDDVLAASGGFRVVIAGGGDEPYVASLKALARELRLEDIALFPGFVTGREKVSMFQLGDVFILPSEHENFGFVWAEAMASGTPVIVSKGVGIWPELLAGGAAEVLQTRDEACIASTLTRLLTDDTRRADLKARARPWVFEHLDPGALAERYRLLYESADATA